MGAHVIMGEKRIILKSRTYFNSTTKIPCLMNNSGHTGSTERAEKKTVVHLVKMQSRCPPPRPPAPAPASLAR